MYGLVHQTLVRSRHRHRHNMAYEHKDTAYDIYNTDLTISEADDLAREIVKQWVDFATGGSIDGKTLKFVNPTAGDRYAKGISYSRGQDASGFYVEIKSVAGVQDLVDNGRKEYNMKDSMLKNTNERMVPIKNHTGGSHGVLMYNDPKKPDAWTVPAFHAYNATKHFADLANESIKQFNK